MIHARGHTLRVRDLEAIDADLRLAVRAWRVVRVLCDRMPSTSLIDQLLDERAAACPGAKAPAVRHHVDRLQPVTDAPQSARWSQRIRLSIVLTLNIFLIGALVIVGLTAGSVGALAAAGDTVADSVALLLGLIAVVLGTATPTIRTRNARLGWLR